MARVSSGLKSRRLKGCTSSGGPENMLSCLFQPGEALHIPRLTALLPPSTPAMAGPAFLLMPFLCI